MEGEDPFADILYGKWTLATMSCADDRFDIAGIEAEQVKGMDSIMDQGAFFVGCPSWEWFDPLADAEHGDQVPDLTGFDHLFGLDEDRIPAA